MAGIANVFKNSINIFKNTNETINIQRNHRFALEMLFDDLSQAGLMFPERLLPSFLTDSAANGGEPLFSIIPDKLVNHKGEGENGINYSAGSENLKADEITFFMDEPLNINGKLARSIIGESFTIEKANPAPTEALISFSQGNENKLRQGDLIVLMDGDGERGNWEFAMVAGSTNPIIFETNQDNLGKYCDGNINVGIVLSHKQGVPILFIRPSQLIRYSVKYIFSDKSKKQGALPCLVRQQMDYPSNGERIDWELVPKRIIAEGVQGFKIDLSFDNGLTWARSTGCPATWKEIQGNADQQLALIGVERIASIADPQYPDWFRYINCLIKIELTTRIAINVANSKDPINSFSYRTRTHSILVSPRNYGVEQFP